MRPTTICVDKGRGDFLTPHIENKVKEDFGVTITFVQDQSQRRKKTKVHLVPIPGRRSNYKKANAFLQKEYFKFLNTLKYDQYQKWLKKTVKPPVSQVNELSAPRIPQTPRAVTRSMSTCNTPSTLTVTLLNFPGNVSDLRVESSSVGGIKGLGMNIDSNTEGKTQASKNHRKTPTKAQHLQSKNLVNADKPGLANIKSPKCILELSHAETLVKKNRNETSPKITLLHKEMGQAVPLDTSQNGVEKSPEVIVLDDSLESGLARRSTRRSLRLSSFDQKKSVKDQSKSDVEVIDLLQTSIEGSSFSKEGEIHITRGKRKRRDSIQLVEKQNRPQGEDKEHDGLDDSIQYLGAVNRRPPLWYIDRSGGASDSLSTLPSHSNENSPTEVPSKKRKLDIEERKLVENRENGNLSANEVGHNENGEISIEYLSIPAESTGRTVRNVEYAAGVSKKRLNVRTPKKNKWNKRRRKRKVEKENPNSYFVNLGTLFKSPAQSTKTSPKKYIAQNLRNKKSLGISNAVTTSHVSVIGENAHVPAVTTSHVSVIGENAHVPAVPASEPLHVPVIGENMYVPASVPVLPPKGLRPIVIDGSNVAMGHGNSRVFSVKGITICVDYFRSKGHKVVVFLPQYSRAKTQSSDRNILDSLQKEGILSYTPSRTVNRKTIASYDDRFIVQYAAACGGIIVSRDNYRDLLQENPSWTETIEKRLLMFTWVGDTLMFPTDPLGRSGPALKDFLKF